MLLDPIIDTWSSACWGNRHWICSGWLHYFFRPWKRKKPCACPCHIDSGEWRDNAGAFYVSTHNSGAVD